MLRQVGGGLGWVPLERERQRYVEPGPRCARASAGAKARSTSPAMQTVPGRLAVRQVATADLPTPAGPFSTMISPVMAHLTWTAVAG